MPRPRPAQITTESESSSIAWWAPADERHGGGVIEGRVSLLEVWWTDEAPPAELPPPAEVVPSAALA